MSNKSQQEDSGLVQKRSLYKPLDKTWVYNCPQTNPTYTAFGNGTECLCASKHSDRTVMDQHLISGSKSNQFQVSNNRLGW